MKRIIKAIPAWLKVVLYFGILALATAIAGLVPFLNDFWFFVLVAAVLSQLFFWSTDSSVTSLNFIPKQRLHWRQFFTGIAAGILMLLLTTIWTLYLTGDVWYFSKPDPAFIAVTFLACFWSAFAQEFVFRGYPFQTLLAEYGARVAQLAIVIPFAAMHFHRGMSVHDIAMTTLTTGLGSLLFGLAYLRTRHLALPVGLHLGWNFAQTLFPRTTGTNQYALITVSGDPARYDFMNMVMPFIVVVILSMLLLTHFNKPGQKATTVPEKS